jgi:hypothetical protein
MKKLKKGDIVSAKFLGTTYKCVVIEVTDKNIYKLRMKYSDTILPSAQWKKHSKKGAPWFIESLIEELKKLNREPKWKWKPISEKYEYVYTKINK